MEDLGIGYVILRHLFDQDEGNHDDTIAPFEVCQPGIAAATGITRAHAAMELRRLKAKGYVRCRGRRHVNGTVRTHKAYGITKAGIAHLVELGGAGTEHGPLAGHPFGVVKRSCT